MNSLQYPFRHESTGNVAAFLRTCAGTLLIGLAVMGSAMALEENPPPPVQSVKMNFKDTLLETVLEQLSEMTGLIILKDVSIEGRITIISKQAMNLDEAIALLNSVLKEKGYVGIRTGKVLKLVKLDDAKKHNIPVHTGSDPAKIDASDEVITQIIPVRYIDAIQLKKDFAPLIPGYADLSANAGSNSLIVTDTSANVRRIAEIVQAMDTQSTQVAEVKVFHLKFANATNAARLINDTFKDDDRSAQANLPPFLRGGFGGLFQGQRGGGGNGGGGAAQPAADSPDQQSQRLKKVTASADDRTNAIVVSASHDNMNLVAEIVKDLDSNPADVQKVFIFKCMNGQATNLATLINALFSPGTTTSTTPTTTANRPTTATTTQTGIGQNVVRSGPSGSTGTSSFGQTTAQPSGFNQTSSTAAAPASRPASLSSDLTNQVYAVADTDTNSVLVLTAPKNEEQVTRIFKDLDRPVPQVLIKVLICEVTLNNNSDIGVDTSVLTNGAVKSALTSFGESTLTGGLVATTVFDNKNLSATVGALESIGKVEVLSRPYILASDNQPSSIIVGNEVPFVISSLTTDTGQQVNTIQYQSIGIILNVTAHINGEGLVIMDVGPQVSAVTGQTIPITAGVNAPVFSQRQAQSRVAIRDGQTVVIGGMMQDNKTDTETGIPGLRRIPGLGMLFRRKTTDKTKTELLFFLTPHVAHIPDVLKDMTEQEKAGLKIVPKAVSPGMFDEHMRGMERGAVSTPENAAPKVETKGEVVKP